MVADCDDCRGGDGDGEDCDRECDDAGCDDAMLGAEDDVRWFLSMATKTTRMRTTKMTMMTRWQASL